MTRSERQKLKLKYKRMLWWCLSMILLFALNIVLLVTINWRPEFVTNASEVATTGDLIIVMSVVLLLVLPIFLGLSFNVRATWALNELYAERKRMYKQRLRLYVVQFFEAIVHENYDEAKRIHNDLIWGDVKSLTRGVMVGLLHVKGSKEDKELAMKNMTSVPREVYDPTKEN